MSTTDLNENRRTQLSELNSRARTYASQLWQVPFGYLALVGVLLTQLNSQSSLLTPVFISALGTSVLAHMGFVVYFHNNTVQKIIKLEATMGLNKATSIGPGGTVAPFMALVFLGILSPLVVYFQSDPVCLVVLMYIVLILSGVVAYVICNHLLTKSIADTNDNLTPSQDDSNHS